MAGRVLASSPPLTPLPTLIITTIEAVIAVSPIALIAVFP